MQSISDPLNLLHEDGSWFARAHELRLWVVHCDENLRGSVISILPKLEFHHDNASAWSVLPDAHIQTDWGWQLRANRLADNWDRRVEAFAEEGIEQIPVTSVQMARPLDGFRATASSIIRGMVEPLRGLVVVLAPTVVDQVNQLEATLSELLGDPALQLCRWVLVLDVDAPPPHILLDALGPERAMLTPCRVDMAQQRQDLDAMLAGGDPIRFGMAGPVGVSPPPRVKDPPPVSKQVRDAELRKRGVDPAMFDHAAKIREKLLQASIAMKDGRGPDAIEAQRGARDLCAKMDDPELWIITQVTLASYLSGLGHRPQAIRELQLAIDQARARGLGRLHTQALLAMGMLHTLDNKLSEAMVAYTEAGRVAEAADEPILAIESWRSAGQLAACHRQDEAAENAFRHALRLAAGIQPTEVKSSSAPEAARQLAAIYERHRMQAQAASLYAQADAMDRGEEITDAS